VNRPTPAIWFQNGIEKSDKRIHNGGSGVRNPRFGQGVCLGPNFCDTSATTSHKRIKVTIILTIKWKRIILGAEIVDASVLVVCNRFEVSTACYIVHVASQAAAPAVVVGCRTAIADVAHCRPMESYIARVPLSARRS